MFRGLTKKQCILDGFCILLCAAALVCILILYPSLPKQIPTHFNANGEINGTGAKSSVFFLLALMYAMTAMFSVLARLKSLYRNINLPWPIPRGKEPEIIAATKDFLCISNLCVTVDNAYLIFACISEKLNNLILWAPYVLLAVEMVRFLLRVRRICKP